MYTLIKQPEYSDFIDTQDLWLRLANFFQASERGIRLPASERGIKILLASERGINILLASERGINIFLASERGINILPPSERGINMLPASERGIIILQASERGIILPASGRGIILPVLKRGTALHITIMLCHLLCGTKYIKSSSINLEIGGHRTRPITYEVIAPYIDNSLLQVMNYSDSIFYFIDHVSSNDLKQYIDIHYLVIKIPLVIIIPFLPLVTGCRIAALHGMKVSRPTIALLQSCFKEHRCEGYCANYQTVLSIDSTKYNSKIKRREQTRKRMKLLREKVNADTLVNNGTLKPENPEEQINGELEVVEKINIMNISGMLENKINMEVKSNENFVHVFPPKPLDKVLAHTIIKSTCDAMEAKQIEEAGLLSVVSWYQNHHCHDLLLRLFAIR